MSPRHEAGDSSTYRIAKRTFTTMVKPMPSYPTSCMCKMIASLLGARRPTLLGYGGCFGSPLQYRLRPSRARQSTHQHADFLPQAACCGWRIQFKPGFLDFRMDIAYLIRRAWAGRREIRYTFLLFDVKLVRELEWVQWCPPLVYDIGSHRRECSLVNWCVHGATGPLRGRPLG